MAELLLGAESCRNPNQGALGFALQHPRSARRALLPGLLQWRGVSGLERHISRENRSLGATSGGYRNEGRSLATITSSSSGLGLIPALSLPSSGPPAGTSLSMASLVGLEGLGSWLGLVLEVFSNLNISMIPAYFSFVSWTDNNNNLLLSGKYRPYQNNCREVKISSRKTGEAESVSPVSSEQNFGWHFLCIPNFLVRVEAGFERCGHHRAAALMCTLCCPTSFQTAKSAEGSHSGLCGGP